MPVCIYRTLAVRAEYYALLLGKGEKVKKKMDNIYIPTIALQAGGRQKIGYSSAFQELWKNTG